MRKFVLALFAASLSLSVPGAAQERDVPYWATVRATKVNMRVGPSVDYRIDWVYQRQGLPLKVIRVVEGWRLVRDPAGAEGWIVARLLSPDRGAIVVGEGLAPMRDEPSRGARLKWNLEAGVVGRLGDCESGWCEFTVTGHAGWVQAARLWGAGEP